MPVGQNDVLAATWKASHTNPNTKIIQTFYFQVTDLVDGDDALNNIDLRDELINLYSLIAPHLANRYVMDSVRVTNQTLKTLLGEGAGGGFTGNGGVGEALPAQDAALVVARPQQLGIQGRKYLGPILEDSVDNGALNAPALAAMDAFGQRYDSSFIGPNTGNTFQPGVARFAAGGAVAGFTAFDTFLSTAYSDMRTQRSRRPAVGLS